MAASFCLLYPTALDENLIKIYENYIFRCHGKTLKECVSQYEEAKIYDGRTIYEAEHEITVLFG